MPVKKPTSRLPAIPADKRNAAQRALVEALRASPRGRNVALDGPFGCFLHAPEFGHLAQELGAYCRYKTSLPPRLSEFAILCTGRIWRAQYEWHIHAGKAELAGVLPATIRDVKAGRAPKRAPKDERAIHDFIAELHKRRRVSDRTYARVHGLLGDAGTVELVGILGYYVLIAMLLGVFRVPLPEGAAYPFGEPSIE